MLIVANWKAYVETPDKAKRLYAAGKRLAGNGIHEIVLAPAAPYLGFLAIGNRSNVEFGAQDISRLEGGAETGEITAATVANVGATYVIVGHSERRAMGENNAIVLEKVRQALAHGLIPIVCIGERERDTEARYLSQLRADVSAIFEPLSPKNRKKIVIAYEPIWAIGKTLEEAITPADLTEMVLYIRKLLTEFVSQRGSAKIKILYGGSVEAGNVRSLAGSTGIDGFLVGHMSADVTSFGALVKALG